MCLKLRHSIGDDFFDLLMGDRSNAFISSYPFSPDVRFRYRHKKLARSEATPAHNLFHHFTIQKLTKMLSLLVAINLACAAIVRPFEITPSPADNIVNKTFSYVIVGGGTAGE